MTPAEAQPLIMAAAAFDNPRPDPIGVEAEAWAIALGDVNIQAAVDDIARARRAPGIPKREETA